MTDISDWRKKIDALDARIIGLLGQRAECAIEIGHLKKTAGAPVFDPKREAEVIARLKSLNKKLPAKSLEAIYREIFSAARAIEKPITVAYLGPAGTFANEAALEIFGASSVFTPCPGFEAVFKEVERGEAEYGVLPIENSTEGSVNLSLDLLRDSPLNVCGEKTITAHQTLVSKQKGLKNVKRLYSHPQPLSQCRNYLSRTLPGVTIVETFSTASAAERTAGDKTSAAICSLTAARNFRLHVLDKNIEDYPNNQTRFMVLAKRQAPRTGRDKTSIAVTIKNRPGSLYRLLGVFEKGRINLTKIVSRPIPRSNWSYLFYIDLEGHIQDPKVANALKAVDRTGESLKILGSYPRE